MSAIVPTSLEASVARRYADAAQDRQAELCCPIAYDPRYLAAIPEEVIERDYGCGDPSRYCQSGDVVLDLGSGTGKICFIAAQIVGSAGRVIGVDMTDEMLEVARRNTAAVAANIGYANVEFKKGRIQDLTTDHEAIARRLKSHPIADLGDWEATQEWIATERISRPLIASESIDLVVSNCVLNLVRPDDKRLLFAEMFRVLRRGGRVALSDIVADEPVPAHLRADETLWSGCVSGALTEEEFLDHLAAAGFHAITIDKWESEPFTTVAGIEFRSITVTAHKGKAGECWDHNEAVIYKGPWSSVTDDDGHRLDRGVRVAVCRKTFAIYSRPPYADNLVLIAPREAAPARSFANCDQPMIRRPARESKGAAYDATSKAAASCCAPDAGCC